MAESRQLWQRTTGVEVLARADIQRHVGNLKACAVRPACVGLLVSSLDADHSKRPPHGDWRRIPHAKAEAACATVCTACVRSLQRWRFQTAPDLLCSGSVACITYSVHVI